MKRICITYVSTFLATVAIAVGLLWACTYLPQDQIEINMMQSGRQIYQEGDDFFVADHSRGTRMSNNSESLMLMESMLMNREKPDAILSNPTVKYENSEGQIENFYRFSQGEEPDSEGRYSRYWMGFRVTLRTLSVFFNYYQIRRFAAFLFFMLLTSALCSIAKNINTRIAMLFAFALGLVKPHVIAVSLQSFTCFTIAFIAIILIPWIYKHPKYEGLFFMEIGIITMFFDFYTVPLITLGLPIMYLTLLRNYNGENVSCRKIIYVAFAWLAGYGCMWLAKLTLTTIFTSEDALQIGFQSFVSRVGIEKSMETEKYYNPLLALYNVAWTLMADNSGIKIYFAVGFGTIIVCIIQFVRRKMNFKDLIYRKEYVLVAFLPILWFCVAAQPTAIHHYFQYRTIVVFLWAGMVYLYETFFLRQLKKH